MADIIAKSIMVLYAVSGIYVAVLGFIVYRNMR